MDFLTVQKTISAWGFAVYEEENTVSILSGVMRFREEGKVWLAGIVFFRFYSRFVSSSQQSSFFAQDNGAALGSP